MSEYDHLKEGNYYITISCNADCNPECSYQFYRDEHLVHKDGGRISILAGRNMSGRYTCSAKNSIMKTYKISTNFVDINIKCMFKKCVLLRLKVICVCQFLSSFIYFECYLRKPVAYRSPISTKKDLSLLVVLNECLI